MSTADETREELLREALWDGDFTAASDILQDGIALDDLIEEDGNSFLHDAAQDGNMEMVDFFLKHGCSKTLASFDYISMTPLIRAADHGQTAVVRKLIEAGSDVNAHDEENIGNTAIREAVRGGHVEIVRLLLAAGADPTIPGWMQISAVDQAHHEIRGGMRSPQAKEIQALLAKYPSTLR